ncbi:hypothetical protein SPRG_16583 [Saprolegnia parasitica CBS 223.65]|uniref:Uncharacterized protein n=1 Tax=Saprolegnia parasitica (strain CBS 223.65) TaxID=695850 RepID=A0A067BUN3_SAPPC|nr:hypothetical protein SPRG_16583 [Saprolegnia parasitica CBS 223.65]KDO18001.1 hypothetical protein SPRG_16583 [Saprolegnia parasitica CBS 223.65]|eukprot:XP_012211291.1 hypothetical protein SPRG_16583 [Saprolegnia parasitica CBS 223.65]
MHRSIDHEALSSLYASRKRYTATGDEDVRPSLVSAILQSQYPDSRRHRHSAHLSTNALRTNKSWNFLESSKQLQSPLDEASVIAKLTLAWLNPLFKQGATEPLDADDVPSLRAKDSVLLLHKRFQARWIPEQQSNAPRLFRALLWTLAPELARAFGCHGLYLVINLVIPTMIKGIVSYLSSGVNPVTKAPDQPLEAGLVFAFGLALLSFLGVTVLGFAWSVNIELSNCARSIVMDQVYLKAVSAPTVATTTYTSGDVMTLANIDSERLFHGLTCICYVLLSPLALLAIFVLIGFEMGPIVAITGACTMAGFLLSAFGLSYALSAARDRLVDATSRRLSRTQELLQSIRTIKLGAYESTLLDAVFQLRAIELRCLGWFQLLCNVNIDVFVLAPVFTTVAMFAVADTAEVSAGAAFAVVSLMVVARFPCNIFRRPCGMPPKPSRPSAVDSKADWIALTQASFAWCPPTTDATPQPSASEPTTPGLAAPLPIPSPQETSHAILKNITFRLRRTEVGSFTVVVGPVGSGKSSFLRAMLGDMWPRPAIAGNMAYASQEPWLIDDTVRNNVLLHRPYVPSLYRRVLGVTGLILDTAAMASGDLTMVGERGAALSGGQRSRINLARALYQVDSADIFLLDDPLSALDLHVASHVFHEVKRFLRGKQVLMAMNAHHHLLVHATRVITLTAGTIVGDESSTSRTTLYKQGGADSPDVDDDGEDNDGFVVLPAMDTIASSVVELPNHDTPAVLDTTASVAALDDDMAPPIGKTYLAYLGASGAAPWLVLLTLIALYTVYQVAYYITDYYLDTAVAAGKGSMETYAGLALATVVASCLKDMFVILVSLRCSASVHAKALTRVVGASVPAFFDTTALGDILNRFSTDLAAMDTDLPYFTYQFATDAFHTTCIVLVVCYYTPLLIALFLPLGYLFVSYQMYNLLSATALKGLDLASRAPLVTNLSETLDGRATIQAAHVEKAFVEKHRVLIDANAACYGIYWLAGTWLEIRLGWLSALVVSAVAIAIVCLRASMDAHIAGLVLVYVMSLSANVQEVLRVMGYVQTYTTSVARLFAYHSLPAEVDLVATASAPWPSHGRICFDQYSMRYQPHLPLVLSNISLVISAGEKVGICGRTGSGKSSLLSALMRLVPGDAGCITIDGVDVTTVPLTTLRSRITVIPQSPVLFAGSLRTNLDPTGEATTEALTLVLNQIHLAHLGLDFVVENGGNNVSVGQRQLVCFGRALLRQSRIVILDEATAFVDAEMERVLQEMLAKCFRHTTMLTIAHRLQTIIDSSDKVLVLDAGAVLEFDAPTTLLRDTSSAFYQLVQATS